MIMINLFKFQNKKFKHVIWIKVPKTAGTSLQAYLSNKNVEWTNNDFDKIYQWKTPLQGYAFRVCHPGCHSFHHLRENVINIIPDNCIAKYIRFRKKEWENSFKFIIVRNPYDRFVSGYNQICKDESFNGLNNPFNKMDTFNYQKLPAYPRHHIIDEIYFKGVEDVNFIIKMENLVQDLKELFKIINFPFEESKFPYINDSNSNIDIYEKYYKNNDNMIRYVNKQFERDFKFFGYNKIYT